jgi:hypothetical protein
MKSKDRVNAWISDPVGGLYYDPCEMTSGDSNIRNHRLQGVQVKMDSTGS